MKTRKEIEESLYERYFSNRKENARHMLESTVIMIVGIIVDVVFRHITKYPGYTFMTTFQIVGGLTVASNIVIVLSRFLRSTDVPAVEKEREKVSQRLEKLEREKFTLEKFEPENTAAKEKLEEKIICLEFELRMIGGVKKEINHP